MATYTFGISSAPLTGNKVFTGTDTDAQQLLDWASSAYEREVQAQTPAAQFKGTIAGTALTVTQLVSGVINIGSYVYGPGVGPASRVVSGSGNSWTLANPSTVATAVDMTTHGVGQVGTQLGLSVMQGWNDAARKLKLDMDRAAVQAPPPMSWS